MAVDLAKSPEESSTSYISRLGAQWAKLNGNLTSCRRENEELWSALDVRDEDFHRLAEEAEQNAKLHPLANLLAMQIVVTTSTYIEERVAEGQPYVVLPVAFLTALGAVVAYVAGAGKTGDGLLAALNGALAVMNTRYTSKKGAKAREEAKAKQRAEKVAETKKAEEKEA